MVSQTSTGSEQDDQQSRLLNLPKELRLLVYRHLLVEEEASVEIVSRHPGLSSIRDYVCDRDLDVFNVDHQVRNEARDVFHKENRFIIYLDVEEHEPTFSISSLVDISYVRRCHLITSCAKIPGTTVFVRDVLRIFHNFIWFALSLRQSQAHHLRCLLIECRHFDKATLFDDTSETFLKAMAKPLEGLRGIGLVHICTLNPELRPYLRALERLMMSKSLTSASDGSNDQLIQAMMSESTGNAEASDTGTGIVEPTNTPDHIFTLFGVKPLYGDLHSIRGSHQS